MATLYLLTELSRVSSVAIHDESDMVWDGSEREEEEQEGGGDGEEAVYEALCLPFLLPNFIPLPLNAGLLGTEAATGEGALYSCAGNGASYRDAGE